MTEFCKPLEKSNPEAYSLCQFLLENGYTSDDIDQGYARPNFVKKGRSSIPIAGANGASFAGDHIPQLPEIFSKAIDFAQRNLALCGSSIFSGGCRFADDFAILLNRNPALSPLWGITAGSGQAMSDTKIREGLLAAPKENNYESARQRYFFLLHDLYIKYSSAEILERGMRAFAEVVLEGEWNCVEQACYADYLAFAGIKTVPLELISDAHVFLGLKLKPEDPSELTFVDFAWGEKGFDVKLKPDEWVEISRMDLYAYAHLNKAFPLSDTDKLPQDLASREVRRKEIGLALQLAPQNYRVVFQSGVVDFLDGNYDLAARKFRKSHELNPYFKLAQEGLAKVESAKRGAKSRRAKFPAATTL